MYIRYVHDVFVIFNSQDEANSVHKAIQFTLETAENSSINFLDLCITLENNSLKTNWTLKNTNTGLYTPKTAYSPTVYKKNAIKALYYKSQNLTC